MANENITKQDLDKVEENLAGMINRSFDKIDKRFDENSKEHQEFFNKFEKIDARLGIIEKDVKEIKEELPKPDEIEDLKAQMDLTEKKVGIVS